MAQLVVADAVGTASVTVVASTVFGKDVDFLGCIVVVQVVDGGNIVAVVDVLF